MHASSAYYEGMKKRQHRQYTIRKVPDRMDKLLRERAVEEHKSLNDAALDALAHGLGASGEPVRYHDLDDLAGSWVDDPEFDRALADMRKIDPEIWK